MSYDGSVPVSCEMLHDYEIEPVVISCLLILTGMILVFYGYKIFQTALFLIAFGVTAFFMYGILERYLADKTEHWFWISIGIALATGLVVGILAVVVVNVGIFLMGFALGAIVGYMLIFVCCIWVPYVQETSTAQWITVVIVGLVFGIVTICFLKKFILVLATSVVGSFEVVNGIDYFLCNRQFFTFMINGLFHDGFKHAYMCPCTIGLIVGWGVLAFVGLMVQLYQTSKDHDYHTHVVYKRRSRHLSHGLLQI